MVRGKKTLPKSFPSCVLSAVRDNDGHASANSKIRGVGSQVRI